MRPRVLDPADASIFPNVTFQAVGDHRFVEDALPAGKCHQSNTGAIAGWQHAHLQALLPLLSFDGSPASQPWRPAAVRNARSDTILSRDDRRRKDKRGDTSEHEA